jgi:hypothetical protein
MITRTNSKAPHSLSFRAPGGISINRSLVWLTSVLLVGLLITRPACAESLQDLLARTSQQVLTLVDQFSQVKCTEQVTQEKFRKDGKTEFKEESTYDYLVILTNAGGELTLDESRLPLHQAKSDSRKNLSLLVSNGFATLFLVFHPFYENSFEFTDRGSEMVNGRSLEKIEFRHVHNMRSPAALALRGREFPLELRGAAWIDAQNGDVVRIAAGLEKGLEDVGIIGFRSQVDFARVPFRDVKESYSFPQSATVELETPRQHWRNTHRFTDYKRFSVSTEQKVTENEH